MRSVVSDELIDSVRLVNGTSLCSGRLELKSDQSNQSWSSVCEADFDQQDAEVVCRELGCGAPSVLQGALYGEGEAPMWTKEFQCGGNESALLDCRSSGSDRNTCSPGRAVGLTCSEPVRLVGGDSRCAGKLELKHEGEWRPVGGGRYSDWTLKIAAAACRDLDCGSAVSVERRKESSVRSVWLISSYCVQSGSALRDCASSDSSRSILDLTCSDSVRLVNGTSLCSGRLELKSDQSNQSWSSVCEADFDQQDAEVVCRELGCGAPSVLQGALYGEGEAPMWTKEFQCGGNESALLDCRSSGSDRNTCSPGRAVGLTCSEPVRLVGGDSRCAGTLELIQGGEWRPVVDRYPGKPVSDIIYDIMNDRNVSNLLLQPNISWSSSMDGVSEAQQQQHQEEFQVFRGSTFTISCSIQPQYPGGSFQLSFTSSTSAINYTQPASPPTKETTAVFITSMFSLIASPLRAVSSLSLFSPELLTRHFQEAFLQRTEARRSVTQSSENQSYPDPPDPPDPRPFIIRAVVLPLILLVANIASYFYFKTHRVYRVYRVQKPRRREDVELDYYNLGVPAAEGGPTEE
ncbi:antigen WC1.1-like [Centropristis striata]|uniref:antigen WC1.1-like n=1 Tax=Centropristis striata TaxID=184440 RepID=UPI0027E184BA|nr:antigen WC1.1-like [Centropristis striata]